MIEPSAETVTGWRPLNGRPLLRMVVRRRSTSRGCEAYRLYARSVCNLQRRCSCSCRLWRHMCMPLPFSCYKTTACYRVGNSVFVHGDRRDCEIRIVEQKRERKKQQLSVAIRDVTRHLMSGLVER